MPKHYHLLGGQACPLPNACTVSWAQRFNLTPILGCISNWPLTPDPISCLHFQHKMPMCASCSHSMSMVCAGHGWYGGPGYGEQGMYDQSGNGYWPQVQQVNLYLSLLTSIYSTHTSVCPLCRSACPILLAGADVAAQCLWTLSNQ